MGKTRRRCAQNGGAEKHPHARGEDPFRLSLGCFPEETPPRTWGRRLSAWRSALSPGNTPTHVGKTSASDGTDETERKHPHARGEDTTPSTPSRSASETPPRTWGRRKWPQWRRLEVRNTPTHVGKTDIRLLLDARQEKHPHARGEDVGRKRGAVRLGETPPRTWGRLINPSSKKSSFFS